MVSTLTDRRFEQKLALIFSRESKTKIVTLKIGAEDANILPNMSCPKFLIEVSNLCFNVENGHAHVWLLLC